MMLLSPSAQIYTMFPYMNNPFFRDFFIDLEMPLL
jgi:hypothetical protein